MPVPSLAHLGFDERVGSIVTMTSASSTPRTPPPMTNSSDDSDGGGGDDSSSAESSADSRGARLALAALYWSYFQLEALVRLAFIRWRVQGRAS